MFSMVLQQFGASAFAQKKIPFSIIFIEFWNTSGTAGSYRLESRQFKQSQKETTNRVSVRAPDEIDTSGVSPSLK